MAAEYDLVVFGATGFTGKQVCIHLARRCEQKPWRWCIAGRSASRLNALSAELQASGATAPGIIVADIEDTQSLREMASSGRLVLNCTGPYRFLGEPVVEACIEVGVDYIDLCGEPEFMDRMLLNHHDQAVSAGVLVVSACAFDSVPADLGVLYTAQLFKSPGVCSSVESFLCIETDDDVGAAGHTTTYEAAVHGFGSIDELKRVRKQLNERYPASTLPMVGPKLARKGGGFYEDRIQRYALPFPGSDAAVVRNSQRILLGDADDRSLCPQYSAYVAFETCRWHCVTMLCGGLFGCCAGCTCGRSCLLQCPGCFTCGAFTESGPTQEQLDGTSFEMKFIARGYSDATVATSGQYGAAASKPPEPDLEICARVCGPEPGYVATPIIFLQVAECMLEERDKLTRPGGVFTPGALFVSSTLIDRLQSVGIRFEETSNELKSLTK